jgi:hypothetical protein
MRKSSSASDDSTYPGFCNRAVASEDVFSSFRSSPEYTQILEHFGFEDGLAYLRRIASKHPALLKTLHKFKINDNYGGATIFEYPDIGAFSPSTLRYVSHLGEISLHFRGLDGCNIVEIGGGYGGLCSTILSAANVRSYTIVDLPEVLELAKKWLGRTLDETRYAKLRFVSGIVPEAQSPTDDLEDYDLAISNFALTECIPSVQDSLISRFVRRARWGFFLYNLRHESQHPAELISKLEVAFKCVPRAYLEIPSTCPTNFVLTFNGHPRSMEQIPVPYRLQRGFYALHPGLFKMVRRLRDRRLLRGAYE